MDAKQGKGETNAVEQPNCMDQRKWYDNQGGGELLQMTGEENFGEASSP